MAEVTPLPNHLSGMILQVVRRPKSPVEVSQKFWAKDHREGFPTHRMSNGNRQFLWKKSGFVERNAVEISLKCSNHFFWKGVSCLKLVPGNLKDAFSMLDSHFKHWLRDIRIANHYEGNLLLSFIIYIRRKRRNRDIVCIDLGATWSCIQSLEFPCWDETFGWRLSMSKKHVLLTVQKSETTTWDV